jgi:hypothetical protein
VGLVWDGHELFSLNIVGKSKWVDRTLAVGLRKGAGGKGIEHQFFCYGCDKMICRKHSNGGEPIDRPKGN